MVLCEVQSKPQVLTTGRKPPCGPSLLSSDLGSYRVSHAPSCQTRPPPFPPTHQVRPASGLLCRLSLGLRFSSSRYLSGSFSPQILDGMSPTEWRLPCPRSPHPHSGTRKNFTRASMSMASRSPPLSLPPEQLAQVPFPGLCPPASLCSVCTHCGCPPGQPSTGTLCLLTIRISTLLLSSSSSKWPPSVSHTDPPCFPDKDSAMALHYLQHKMLLLAVLTRAKTHNGHIPLSPFSAQIVPRFFLYCLKQYNLTLSELIKFISPPITYLRKMKESTGDPSPLRWLGRAGGQIITISPLLKVTRWGTNNVPWGQVGAASVRRGHLSWALLNA